jgi:hypothetical protein
MKNSIKADTVSIFDTSGLSTSFQAMNAGGLTGPTVLIRVYNASNRDIYISYDGSHSHDFLKSGDTLTLNFQNNAAPNNNVAMMKKGTIVYVKGASSGSGNISLSAYYLES